MEKRFFYLSTKSRWVNTIEDYNRICIAAVYSKGMMVNELRRPATRDEIKRFSLVYLGQALNVNDKKIQSKLDTLR